MNQANVREQQKQVVTCTRQLIARYRGLDESEVGNGTEAGPVFRNIGMQLKLEFKRDPVYDGAHPPSEHTTLAELVGMFS